MAPGSKGGYSSKGTTPLMRNYKEPSDKSEIHKNTESYIATPVNIQGNSMASNNVSKNRDHLMNHLKGKLDDQVKRGSEVKKYPSDLKVNLEAEAEVETNLHENFSMVLKECEKIASSSEKPFEY